VISRLIMAAVIFFSAPVAQAKGESGGMYLSLGLIGYQFNVNGSNNMVTERSLLSAETGLGYVFRDWLYIGGIFNHTVGAEKTKDASNLNTQHQQIYQYYGPSLGYMGPGWFLLGHYFLAAQQKDNVSADGSNPYTDDRTGTGFGVSAGYKVIRSTLFELAPSISYKSINYNNCRNRVTGATTPCNPSVSHSEITPYLTFLVNIR
jgi:hypothetical protein